MKKIICCTTQHNVGCTFLEWSINYLSGQTRYFNYKHGWADLSDNPLKSINAHSHPKNHPCGLKGAQECVSSLREHTDFATFFPFELPMDEVAKIQNIDILNTTNDVFEQILQYSLRDYNQMLKWLESQDVKIVFIGLNKSLPLYNYFIRAFDRLPQGGAASCIDDVREGLDLIFFKESLQKWKDLNLTTRWDLRERLALNARPFQCRQSEIDFSIEHYWIDSQEIWYNGENTLINILDWCNVKLESDRLESWRVVYKQWQQIQFKILKFCYQCDHIVDAIINNWDYEIDLTFEQEVVIQHCLIYQHNLNLKTWQLEKFPNNTKDLHNLLETNIHQIEQLY